MKIRCDFCGLEFDPGCPESQGCQGCPLSRNCRHIICPRCGYVILPEASLVRWARRLQRRWQARKSQAQGPQEAQK